MTEPIQVKVRPGLIEIEGVDITDQVQSIDWHMSADLSTVVLAVTADLDAELPVREVSAAVIGRDLSEMFTRDGIAAAIAGGGMSTNPADSVLAHIRAVLGIRG